MAESPLLQSANQNSESQCRTEKPSNLSAPEKSEKIEFSSKLSYNPSGEKKDSSDIKKMPEKVDVIGNVVGDIGKWQLRAIFLIFLCKIPSSWFMACIIYTAPAPRHGEFYCSPPKGIDMDNMTSYIKVMHPIKEEINDKEFVIDFCNVYEDAKQHAHEYFHNDDVDPSMKPRRNSSTIIPCDSFEFQPEYHSVITTFDLVCSRNILVSLTQFFHLFGVLWGGIIATRLMESISPKNVMLAGMYAQIFCGCFCGLINIFELHMMFRTLAAICCGLMYTAGGVIFSDITAGKYKVSAICLFEQFWSIGVILLPGVASFWTNWSALYCAISLPTFILVFLHRWIPDSPRWLIKRGRIRETMEILIESAKLNERYHIIPRDLEHQLEVQSKTEMEEPTPPPYWSIWKEPNVRVKLVACHLAWSIYIVVYYAFLLNIRTYGRDYLEINTVVAGICEIIGTFIGLYLIINSSRKWFVAGMMNVIGGACAYTAFYVPQSIQGSQRIALLMCTSMVAKITISTTLSILTTCTTELVIPEKKKAAGYSTIVWARFWLLGAPFISATSIFGEYVPQSVMGTLTIIGGFITMIITSPRTLPKEKDTTFKYPAHLITPEIWTTKGQLV